MGNHYVLELTGAHGPDTIERNATDDDDALTQAARLMAFTPALSGVYVFCGDRQVGHLHRLDVESWLRRSGDAGWDDVQRARLQ